ncbi:hypothetical protein SEVIR_5G009901v4 [Setaria viridis]
MIEQPEQESYASSNVRGRTGQEIHGPDPDGTAAHQVQVPCDEQRRRVVGAPRASTSSGRRRTTTASLPRVPHGRARHAAAWPEFTGRDEEEVRALILKIAGMYWTTMHA